MQGARKGGVATAVGFVVAGVVAGVLWALIADPVEYTVVRVGDQSGLSADEAAASAAFGVQLTYAWVSGVVAALWSAFATWRWARHGSSGVIARTTLSAGVAAFVTWGVGVLAGPPSPEVGDHRAGALVPARLDVDAYGVLFVWPVAALLALLVVLFFTLPRDEPEVLQADEAPGLPTP